MQESRTCISFFNHQDSVKAGIMFLLLYVFLVLCIDEMLLVSDLLEKINCFGKIILNTVNRNCFSPINSHKTFKKIILVELT